MTFEKVTRLYRNIVPFKISDREVHVAGSGNAYKVFAHFLSGCLKLMFCFSVFSSRESSRSGKPVGRDGLVQVGFLCKLKCEPHLLLCVFFFHFADRSVSIVVFRARR